MITTAPRYHSHHSQGWLMVALVLSVSTPLLAWDGRSITSVVADLYLAEPQPRTLDWGLAAEEVLLLRLAKDSGWFLKANYLGSWKFDTERYVSNFSTDLNYEDDRLWAAVSGNLGCGQNVLTSLWGLSGKYHVTPWLALLAAGLTGWDQALGWDCGSWGYAEFLPGPLLLRLGASAGSFHQTTGTPRSGLEYSTLSQVVWQATDGLEFNLNGQWWFGDRNANKRSLGLTVSLQW